jgi:AcrR family transcriptional regulator
MARKPALVGTDRRQQILEAALDVYAEHGYEGATNKEIASRAGVTPGLIYFYFPSKEDLLYAAFEHQADYVFAQLDLASELENDDPPEQILRGIVERFVETLDAPRSARLMRILLRESVHSDSDSAPASGKCEARGQIKALAVQLSSNLRDYLAAQMQRGALRQMDAALAAHLMTGAIITVILRRAAGNSALAHISRSELTEGIIRLFVFGLAPGC